MKAVLEYTDHLVSRDGKQVNRVLTEHRFEVLKTKANNWNQSVRVTIRVNSYDELDLLVEKLNRCCVYGVKVIKVRRDGIFGRLRKNYNEKRI